MDAYRSQGARCTLVVVFGPPSVGKMTVGREIAARAGYKLLHNHLTIDLLTEFFPFGSPAFERLNDPIRIQILEELAAAGDGVILTAGWRLDVPADRDVVDRYCRPFRDRLGRVAFVELRADLDTRLERNRTEPRRSSKKVDWATDEVLLAADRRFRYHSVGDFPFPDDHYIIDTRTCPAPEAASRVIAHFGLPGDRPSSPSRGHDSEG